ncbi:MAG TPA: CHAT domain-containing protein [Isosphaeraceae bacterium]|nr:CHAT domain-containing protein [Isosphaeraceae bacterium]
MVRLEQLAYDDFLTVRADDPVEQVARLVAATAVQRVVVRRRHGEETLYYLFPRNALLARLGDGHVADLQTALVLHEVDAAPVEDADSDGETCPDICVVLRDGELIGYYDAGVPVDAVRSSRTPEPLDRRLGVAVSGQATDAVAVRHVHADFPETVPQNETVSLLVSLRRATAGGNEVPVAVADGVIDVVVRPDKGFVLDGRGEAQLRVTNEDESLPIQFKLRAAEIGPGRIKVFCLQGGTTLGAVILHPLVLAPGAKPTGSAVGVTGPLAPPPPADADLILLIRDWPEPGGRRLEYTLKAADPAVGLHFKRFYSDPFQTDPQAFFRQLYFGLDQRLQEAGGADAEAQLASYGGTLFDDLFPHDLRALLWDLRDRVKTVQVLSDEAWVPWELVKFSGPDGNGGVVDGPFLCQAFRLTRWFPEVPRRPQLRLGKMAVVAPTDSGLQNAVPERDYLLGLAVANRREVAQIPARYADVRAALQKGMYDGWHFVGHAAADSSAPDESLLQLEAGAYLRANDISGALKNCGKPRPLVFLNGCQTGQGAMGLTGASGWASKFVRAGAAAFVGTLWSVRDGSAQQFASAFYDHLLAGMTVAGAAFEARKTSGVTGLAYTVFADPFAAVMS